MISAEILHISLVRSISVPSLRILMEAELDDAEWVRNRYDQLMLIDKKRLRAV
uniref:Uncharacterized protein n=1 Tax=Utricularia reniformis TaxID=192314 RepID=A0A1Y0AZE1_9LAMI|nr:hypothetical protein AEK19_MT0221 [Utricularia reniformis]ART30499.1 hypothetical protein AEK19_MT0221 [Utricularia reniformis]